MSGKYAPGSDPYPGLTPVAGYGPPTSVAVTSSGFAGTMLVLAALFQILQGIAALAADTSAMVSVEYIYELDVTTWGWIHISVGAAAFAAGLGVLRKQTWAYVAGLALAILASIVNFAFLPYYPLWSAVIIALTLAVIWALIFLLGRRS
ncbi:hypothetical protein [Promicromonospora sp. MEB111]|uniref:DUF7144 family membrane protein n=1 Tax=unclassified Promicromonospora TaxID=2647929 RepID=UPI002550E8E6|nr:hypothetical protein [Promicromonospora sp. MEB111]